MTFNPLTALRALRDRQDLSSGEFGVMVAVVLRADAQGAMWASQATLAKDSKLSARSVREKMASLMEKELLIRVKRPGTSDYCAVNTKALTPEEFAAPPVLTLAESAAHPGEICLPPRQNLPHTPEKSAAYLTQELPSHLPSDLPKKKVPQIETASQLVPWSTQWWHELWTELNQELDTTRTLKLTKKRKEALKARLLEHGEKVLFDVVRWYAKSSHPRAVFLRERGYTIDTVLQRSKFDQYATMSELPEGSVTDNTDPLSILGAARKLRLEEGQL